MCKPDSTRVLVVYGTETGGSRSNVDKFTKQWKADGKGYDITVMTGNEAAGIFDDKINKENYEVLLICTSSFNDGDPPTGFGKFVYKLNNAEASHMDGIQHSVCGLGSSNYITFQNIPRLCDKLMEKAGSKRFVKRMEIDDDVGAVEGKRLLEEWVKGVEKLMDNPASMRAPKVVSCDWEDEKNEILNLHEDLGPDGFPAGHGPGGLDTGKIVMAASIVVVAILLYQMNQASAEENA